MDNRQLINNSNTRRSALRLGECMNIYVGFSLLMGDDVPPRRAFIEQNATYANIDA